MHFDPVAAFYIVWGLGVIVFRRPLGRQYVIVREMTKSIWGTTTQRRGELLSVVVGSAFVLLGTLFLLVAP